MNAKILIRIAAALLLIHLLGHLLGHFGWDTPEDLKMQEVVDTMKRYKADFMGATRSMADYYHGYSLMLCFVFGMTICILWFASDFIELARKIVVKILYPIAITYIAFGVIEFLYFFPFAAVISLLTGLFTFAAIIRSQPTQ